MLKKIKIKDFRSHENVELEFHPGVNVIYGLGQSGKTNILRAINWVVNNRPSGFNMHSHFSDDDSTMVELTLDNGSVCLSKTSKLTTYSIVNGSSYSYTGKSVPEPIVNLLNISEINISNQLDAPFLITDSPGEVGKVINRITKIEQVDSWISKLTTLSNSTKAKLDVCISNVLNLEQELSKYDGLEELEKKINYLGKLDIIIESQTKKYQSLRSIIQQHKELEQKINQIDMKGLWILIKREDKFNDIIQTLKSRWEGIFKLKKSITIQEKKIDEFQLIVNNLDPKIQYLIKTKQDIVDAKQKSEQLNLFLNKNLKVNNLKIKMKEVKKEYINGIKELKICPLCQNTMSTKHIKELEKNL